MLPFRLLILLALGAVCCSGPHDVCNSGDLQSSCGFEQFGLNALLDRIAPTIAPDRIPALALWLRADALASGSDGTPVSTWPDSSGQGNVFNQGTANMMPAYYSGVVNGLPVVRFSPAVNPDRMQSVEFLNYQNPAVFVVARTNATGDNQRIFNDMGSAFAEWLWVGAKASNNATAGIRDVNSSQISTEFGSMERFRIIVLQVNGRSALFSADGVVAELAKPEYVPYSWETAFAPPTLGTTANSTTGNPVDGDVAEVIVYRAVLTHGERRGVECYLSYKYAISVPQLCTL